MRSVRCKGHASLIIDKLMRRRTGGLATYKQLIWLRKLGVPKPHLVTFAQAHEILERHFGKGRASS
jgi:hypothetical protein